MTETQIKLPAAWTDDCQGKKDYDGDILSISTRYWPRGGSFTAISNVGGELKFETGEARPQIKPSATSSLVLWHGEADAEDSITMATQSFEAETEEEVKRQVEVWAQEQMDRVVAILNAEFHFKPTR